MKSGRKKGTTGVVHWGRTILFHKNDKAVTDPKNFRPITMVNALYKVFTTVVESRIIRAMIQSNNWNKDQVANRKFKRGCFDAHLISENIVQKYRKIFRKAIHIAYIDFQKAYDSVSHQGLSQILKTLFVNGNDKTKRLYNTVTKLMSQWHTYVVNLEGQSSRIDIKRGIFQGDKMSPTLFCVALTILRTKPESAPTNGDSPKWSHKV